MWFLRVDTSKLVLYDGKAQKEVKGLKPSEAGCVLVTFADETRRRYQLNRFVGKSVLSKKLKKFVTTRSLFCKKTREYMAQSQSSDSSSSSTDAVPDTDDDDDDDDDDDERPAVEEHTSDLSSDLGESESSNDRVPETDLEDVGVLPPLPVKTDYLYENKIKGRSVEVHLLNLVQPSTQRRVRDLDTAHVHELTKSFLESPDLSSDLGESESSNDRVPETDLEDVGVLPPLPVKTDYLYENKIKGRSVEVHLLNLVQPSTQRRVRDLDTAHVHELTKSFLESPGGEFHLLAGCMVSGSLNCAKEVRGVNVEVLGGNHTRAALLSLFQQGLRHPYVLVTVYEGLTDEEALKIGLHHNESNQKAKPMSFMDKVSVIVKLNQDTKAIASVFGKKDGRQVRNDLAVHLAVSRWPEDVRRQLKQADLKWFKPCKPLSQTIVKSLTKHKEMGKYVREGVSILFTEGVKAYKNKLSLWMREEGVGKFRRATPPEVDGLVPLENDAAIENEHVFKSQFNVGDVVLAKWSDGNLYDAKIKKVEIVYHVQYVEDKVHKKVSQEDVQKK